MAEDDRLELLTEAARRGLDIGAERREFLDEAVRRGLIRGPRGLAVADPELAAQMFRGTAMGPQPSVEGQSLIPLVLSTAGSFAPGGPMVKATGAATGATVGEVITPDVFRLLGKAELERPSLFDLAKTFGLTFLLDLTGLGVMRAAGKLPGLRATPEAQRTLEAFRETGVEPKVTDIAGTRLPAVLEKGVQQTPLGGMVLSETVERQAGQVLTARETFLGKLRARGAESEVAAGETARDAIKLQADRVKAVEDYLWQDLRGAATDLPVNLAPLKRAATEVKLQLERRGELSKTLVNTKLNRLADDILKAGETAPWQKVDEWRRAFGEGIQSSELFTGLSRGQQERFYAASLDAMERAAAGAEVPGLGEVFRRVRQFGAQARDLYKDSAVARVMDAAPETIVSLLQAKGGPTAIREAREAILGSPRMGQVVPTPDALDTWNLVRRHILEGMFERSIDRSAKGMVTEAISGLKLQHAIDKIGRETLGELLLPAEQKALDNILTVAKAVRLGERAGVVGGTSITPQGMTINALFTGVPSALGWFAAGGPGAVVGATGGALFAPIPLARLLTNPRAAEFLASPRFTAIAATINTAGRVTGELDRAMLRAVAIVSTESDRASRIQAERGRSR